MTINFGHLSNLCNQIADLEKRIRASAQAEFKPALKDVIIILREQVPQLSHFKWNQYTPSFNDGDVCEFTLGDIEFKFRDDENDDYYDSTFNEDKYDRYNFGLNPLVKNNKLTVEQAKLLIELSNTIRGLETACEMAFGTDTEITVDIDSGELTTEEFECGY